MSDKTHPKVSSYHSMERPFNQGHIFAFKEEIYHPKIFLKNIFTTCHYANSTFSFIKTRTIK